MSNQEPTVASERLTDEHLAMMRQHATRAATGPWRAHHDECAVWVADEQGYLTTYIAKASLHPLSEGVIAAALHNAEFIAHARTDIPALLAEVDRLREENERLTAESLGWQQVVDEEKRTREIAQERYGVVLGEKSALQAEIAALMTTSERCDTCGHSPCACDAMRAADDTLYGWTCPDCGERLAYEDAWHSCVDAPWDEQVEETCK